MEHSSCRNELKNSRELDKEKRWNKEEVNSSLCVQKIPLEKIRPNIWNPNKMQDDIFQKLKRVIEKEGFLIPLVVRPLTDKKEKFEIVDGEHRYRIAKEMGLKEVDCVVVNLSDSVAKIKSLQLNGLRGENEPEMLARLIEDLSLDFSLDALEQELPFERVEIEESLELLRIEESEQKRGELKREMEEMLRFQIFSVLVSAEERRTIEDAISLWQARSGEENKGGALAQICKLWLENRKR